MQIHRQAFIALRMVSDKPSRLILSILGVSFSVVIMFMEMGFFNGTNDSSANLPHLFDCDLVMSSPLKTHLKTGEEFHYEFLMQARGVPGVAAVVPFYMQGDYWWNPQEGTRNRVLLMGVDLDDPMFRLSQIAIEKNRLREPDTVLYDRLSQHDLGRIESGASSQLSSTAVTVVGLFSLGPNFAYEGNIVTSKENYLKITGQAREIVDLGLIRVAPGANVQEVRRRIYATLPKDVLLLTPGELFRREVRVTEQRSPAGIIFGMGLVVGVAIGIIVCYQILFNEVNDHLPQFATMKAIGHRPGFIAGIVMSEALILSLAGYFPGLAASIGLYALIEHLTQIRMFLNLPRAALILVLAGGMCLVAGRLALKKVQSADPADLF